MAKCHAAAARLVDKAKWLADCIAEIGRSLCRWVRGTSYTGYAICGNRIGLHTLRNSAAGSAHVISFSLFDLVDRYMDLPIVWVGCCACQLYYIVEIDHKS
jgi:hypothetical protein